VFRRQSSGVIRQGNHGDWWVSVILLLQCEHDRLLRREGPTCGPGVGECRRIERALGEGNGALRPTIARMIQAGVVMDTRDMTFDPTATTRRYPAISLTSLADVVRRTHGNCA
jgi:hypothetical protein